ncbi:AzlC family ABC transporter permease [Demequina lutea]|uniref:Putative branched-subunit amino acid permease n=1 Tax=Demequina lutea TaxID=431489 RepID=A0A7Y9Z8H8_9MICO|nr:AzlC family ABC transporter permease [Demequina lutea]NYI39903.1 putative branched-subunit amino acid permease [Demequina lutea]
MTSRAAFADGVRDVAGLVPGVTVFGLSFGALVRARGIDPIAGAASSLIVGAGAGQTAAVEVFAVGGAVAIAVLSALIVNARFALYSAALAPMFGRFTPAWRWGLAYFVADQTVGLYVRGQERWKTPALQQYYMLGVTLPMRTGWAGGTVAGILLGPVVPGAWQVGFIVPLMFIALAIPGIRGLPELVAAVTGVVAVASLKDLPLGLNIVTAALLGMTAGLLVHRRTSDDRPSRRSATEPTADTADSA